MAGSSVAVTGSSVAVAGSSVAVAERHLPSQRGVILFRPTSFTLRVNNLPILKHN